MLERAGFGSSKYAREGQPYKQTKCQNSLALKVVKILERVSFESSKNARVAGFETNENLKQVSFKSRKMLEQAGIESSKNA